MRNVKTKIMFLLLCSVLMVNASSNSGLGVKSGDWIQYDFQETFSSVGERWQMVEFLSVVGTKVTIRVTIHMSPAIETNQTRTIDLSSSDNFQVVFFGVRVYLIPSNLGVGVPPFIWENLEIKQLLVRQQELLLEQIEGSFTQIFRRVEAYIPFIGISRQEF